MMNLPGTLFATVIIVAKFYRHRIQLPLPFPPFLDYWRVMSIHKRHLGFFPDLCDPATFNDLIQWLKLFYRRPEMVTFSDKVAVRSVVRQILGEEALIPIIEILESTVELKGRKSDEDVVIKASHDSGSTRIVRAGEPWDSREVFRHFDNVLRSNFGQRSGEWPYTKIPKRLIVEKFLSPLLGGNHGRLVPDDYKFHCVDGEVRFLQFITGRFDEPLEAIVLRDGIWTDIRLDPNFGSLPRESWVKPSRFDDLCQAAERLSMGWRYMRVDLYLIGEQVKFGEATFFPYSGLYTGGGQAILGRSLNDRKSA